MDEDTMTPAEAARELGISERAVHYRLKRGLLLGTNVHGRTWQILRGAVDEAKAVGRLRPGPRSRLKDPAVESRDSSQPYRQKINWAAEMDVIRDMNWSARLNHVWTIEALKMRMTKAEEDGDAKVQRILLAKMAEEAVSAVEDTGGFAWAFRNRRHGGFLRQYLGYQTKHVEELYRRAEQGEALQQLLTLPSRDVLLRRAVGDKREEFNAGLDSILDRIKALASWYLHEPAVKSYMKLKHGFVVMQNPGVILPSSPISTDWTKTISVVTGFDERDNVYYSPIEFKSETITYFENVVRGAADTWTELGYLASLMFDWGIQLWRKGGIEPMAPDATK